MKYTKRLRREANIGFGSKLGCLSFKKKKASAFDLAIVMAMIFAFALTFLIGHYVMGQVAIKVKPILNTSGANVSNYSGIVSQTLDKATDALDILDYAFLALVVGMIIFIILMSFKFQAHPAFYFIFLLFIVIMIVISVAMSNAYEKVENASILNESVLAFPITSHIMGNFPIYIAIIGFISLIVIYAKSRGQAGEMGEIGAV